MRVCWILVALGMAVWGMAQAGRPLAGLEQSAPNLIRADAWGVVGEGKADVGDDVLVTDHGASARPQGGYVQAVELNQTHPAAIVAKAWSRGMNISGEADSGYSLYLDIIFQDGTPLWGQQQPFRTGTQDWHLAEVKVFPPKPIKRVSVYLLMRNHAGRAEFKDISLREAGAMKDFCWLDGQLIRPTRSDSASTLVRDVLGDTGYLSAEEAKGRGLDLKVAKGVDGQTQVTVTDTTGTDRALTVLQTVPVGEGSWRWWSTLSDAVEARAGQEYVNGRRQPAGNGILSRYPVGVVTAGEKGRALAIDLRQPVFYRLGYAEGTKELYLAADVALTREKPSASLAVCEFAFDGRQGMRGAVARYSERFPQAVEVRAKRHGLWMPFFSISKVQGWEDFGFAFKEGIDEPAWDDEHEVITFRYTEPMTWWMAMPKELPRTMEAAVGHARGLVAKGDRDAAAWESSSFRDAEGKIPGRIRKEPWCDGIVWSMNSAPGIDGRSHFQTKWSAAIRQNPGGRTPGRIDGEYIDSVEGYVTDDLDFRREHFAAMQTPLVFDPVTHKPAIYKGFIAYEYVRQIADDCHADGKLTMANGTPGNWPWIPAMIDVMGTETDWKPHGVWTPMPIEDMQYRRAMAGGKPYCYLMNTDFEQFSHADAERYMKRCAAFGFFPGFFSHNAAEKQYFSQSALYNRDRELFKRYVPVTRRLSEAGWRPVSEARSSDAGILVEQFGERYFTVFNAGSERRTAEIQLPAGTASATNLLNGASVSVVEGRMQVTLNGEDVLVVEGR